MRIDLAQVKDIVTIIFYLVTIILAVLTYKRAYATILQPKRSELIKKQTEIFGNFLSFINKNDNSIDAGLDYINLFRINCDLALRDFALLDIEKNSNDYDDINSQVAGWIQFLENDIYNYVFISGDLLEYDLSLFEVNNRARQKFYHHCLEKGEFEIHRIFYTKKHREFYEALREFAFNPFLPSDVQNIAKQIGIDMFQNVHDILKLLLKKLIMEYYKSVNKLPESKSVEAMNIFRHETLFRIFEEERTHHDKATNQLRGLIREYLNIDKKW